MKKIILIILLFLFPSVCFGQNPGTEKEKNGFLQEQYKSLIYPYPNCEKIQAYLAKCRQVIKNNENSESHFWHAVRSYAYYLYEKNGNIKEAKLECPILRWIEDIYIPYGKDKNFKYLADIKRLVISINQKEDGFWKDLDDNSYRKFEDSLEKNWRMVLHYNSSHTCYEIVDGFLILGEEFLASGKRKEAKVAFLRAFNERIIADKECGNRFLIGYPEDIEKIYVKYGYGKEDSDYKEIIKLYGSVCF